MCKARSIFAFGECVQHQKSILACSRGDRLSTGFEEFTKKSASFVGENARGDLWAVIHEWMVEHSETGTHRASFRVICAINDAIDARLENSARAHRARLDGYVERGSSEAMILRRVSSST